MLLCKLNRNTVGLGIFGIQVVGGKEVRGDEERMVRRTGE
jgi:hypothetical protein